MRAEENQQERILVTGVGGPAGRNTVNYLKRKGYTVIGTDIRQVDTEVDEFHLIPAANHPDFLRVLRGVVLYSRASLLIPTVSEELPVIARKQIGLRSTGCMVMIAPYLATAIANDKLLTALCLEKNKISVIKSLAGETNPSDVVAELGLPLIAKPRVSRGGRGVVLHCDEMEVAEEQRNDIVYQKFAPGQEFDVNLYIDRRGIMRSCVVLYKTKLREGLTGNALEVQRVQRRDIAELALSACKAIELTGPADIDIRLDIEGVPRLLEINARLGANVLAASEVIESLLAEWQESTSLIVSRP